jgi:hypothetical protein
MKKTATLNEKLLKRLKSYALTAGALAGAANVADAQEVVYTDVDPDQQANTIGDSIYLDLNNDGTDDFLFFANSFTFASGSVQRVFVYPLGNNAVNASLSGTYAYPYVLPSGNAIDGNQEWLNIGYVQTMAWQTFTSSFSGEYGNWINITDGYIGLRLDLNGQTHYGWARLDVSPGLATLKDYAFESLACLGIEAGSQTSIAPTAAATVNAISGTDVGNAGNGADMQIDITINAGGDANVGEYRVFAVKAENASAFDQAAAEAVAMGNYTAVTPTGSNINLTLDASANDVDGNAIVSNVAYRIFVWSGANCDDSQLNSLSAPSEEVVLEFPAGVNESNIPGLSIFTNGNILNVTNFNADNVNKSLVVYNTQGQMVASEVISGVQSSVDLNLAAGMYIVSMNVNGKQHAHKIILQ